MSREHAATPKERGETALHPTFRQDFIAGMQQAQATARQGGASVYGCCKLGLRHGMETRRRPVG
ncbi:hypothetical protein [Serratia fonticola]|uniref:hypothetical protein n=1 Tax=Serratia fonticola TaxID=47917 RepID=UPI000E2B35C4|nr:hypothetical protein DFO62_12321 [Serratia fonticola]